MGDSTVMSKKRKEKRSEIVLETKSKHVLVSFPKFSYWKQIVSIWSRICYPGPNRKALFSWDKFGTNSIVFCFIPIRHRNVCGTFAPLLWGMRNRFSSLCLYSLWTWNIGEYQIPMYHTVLWKQGWAKLVWNLTFSKRKALFFFNLKFSKHKAMVFPKSNVFKPYSVEFPQKLNFFKA